MGKGLESSVSESKRLAYDLINKPIDGEILLECSICLEPVNENDARTPVTLRCEHRFHLDCIGSAFNTKNKMECPNCRNVEQGQWLYSSGPPNIDMDIDDWIPEESQDIPEFSIVPDQVKDEGMEVCPFQGSHHHNSPEGDDHGEGPLCPYFEYTVILRSSSTATGDAESSNITNQWTTGSREIITLNDSNPSDLIPLSPIPTNPRLFRRASEPEVVRARLYYDHPFNPSSAIGGSRNSTAHVRDASQEYNGISISTYLDQLIDGLDQSSMDDLIRQQQIIERILAHVASHERLLRDIMDSGAGRSSNGGRSNGEDGSGESGSGGGNSHNGGSG